MFWKKAVIPAIPNRKKTAIPAIPNSTSADNTHHVAGVKSRLYRNGAMGADIVW